jgi:hypothetical protein
VKPQTPLSPERPAPPAVSRPRLLRIAPWLTHTNGRGPLDITTALTLMVDPQSRPCVQTRELEWGLQILQRRTHWRISACHLSLQELRTQHVLSMMGSHHRLGQASRFKDLDDDILKHLTQAATVLDPEARGNLAPRYGQFTLFLPLDPRSHTAVGTGPDTIGDIIWRLEPDRWNESNVVITMEAPVGWEEFGTGLTLSWSDRVLATVAPVAIITVSLPLRAQAIPGGTHNGRDPASTIPRTPRHLKGPLVEALYFVSMVGRSGMPMSISRNEITLSLSARILEQVLPVAPIIASLKLPTPRGLRQAWKQSVLRQTLNATVSKVDNLV